MSAHRRDVDWIVEATLARHGLDGMGQRNPFAVILKSGWTLEALKGGRDVIGWTNAERRTVGLVMLGSTADILSAAIHESGHVLLFDHGIKGPHCECCASRAGRSSAMGRLEMVRRLDRYTTAEVIEHYSKTFPPGEVTQRIWEVRQTLMRRAI